MNCEEYIKLLYNDLRNNVFTETFENRFLGINEPIMYYYYDSNFDMVKYLIDNNNINEEFINPGDNHIYAGSLLHRSVYDNNYDMIKFLLENGADINIKHIYYTSKNRPIQYAIENNNLKMIKYLIEKGATIKSDDLFSLSFHGNVCEILDYFILNHNININVTYFDTNNSLLFYSCIGPYVNIENIKWLLDHGAKKIKIDDRFNIEVKELLMTY